MRVMPSAEQRVELARALERGEIVRAADRASVDEDLRHGHAPSGARASISSRLGPPMVMSYSV